MKRKVLLTGLLITAFAVVTANVPAKNIELAETIPPTPIIAKKAATIPPTPFIADAM